MIQFFTENVSGNDLKYLWRSKEYGYHRLVIDTDKKGDRCRHMLHETGWAKEYKIIGKFNTVATWKYGEIYCQESYNAKAKIDTKGYDNEKYKNN